MDVLVVILQLRVGGELHPTALLGTPDGMPLIMHMANVRQEPRAIREHLSAARDLTAMRTLPRLAIFPHRNVLVCRRRCGSSRRLVRKDIVHPGKVHLKGSSP